MNRWEWQQIADERLLVDMLLAASRTAVVAGQSDGVAIGVRLGGIRAQCGLKSAALGLRRKNRR